MACVYCGKGAGLFGGNIAFSCPQCHSEVCKKCAEERGCIREWGGLTGDKHLQITCPNCGSAIKVR
jgi:predicted RNA-binding Zn-ribbon protein involved in translation (DUF1610 family)